MLSMRLRRLYLCLSSSFIFFLRDFGRDTDVYSFAFGDLSQPVRIMAPIRKQPIGLGQVAQQRCRTGVVAKGSARDLLHHVRGHCPASGLSLAMSGFRDRVGDHGGRLLPADGTSNHSDIPDGSRIDRGRLCFGIADLRGHCTGSSAAITARMYGAVS